jgi:hypothetical protein
MSEHLSILAQENHVTVVQTPGHSHPGVVIPGDSLMVLYGSVKAALEMLEKLKPKTPNLEEVILELQSVQYALLEQLAVLESVLESQGMALPYTWSAKNDLEKLQPKTHVQEGTDP